MDLAQALIAYEPHIRLGVFALALAAMGWWEAAAPRRSPALPRASRWTANLSLAAVDTVIVRLLFPFAGVGMAQLASARDWGFFNHVDAPYAAAVLASIVALDFAIYLQHVLFHAVPALWRLHRVHHADLDFDVTTGVRFHPLEIALSLLVKFAVITSLGAPAAAVLLFEVVLNAMAMFSHSNVRIPGALDRALRWLIVTPDMHRIHHSIQRSETDSNFGFNLALWDRLLGTYRSQPAASHEAMVIGIEQFRDRARCATLSGALMLPFRGAPRAVGRVKSMPGESY